MSLRSVIISGSSMARVHPSQWVTILEATTLMDRIDFWKFAWSFGVMLEARVARPLANIWALIGSAVGRRPLVER